MNTAKEKESLARKRIQRLNRFLPCRGKMIDIGSGMGHFLQVARENGFDAIGIEPGLEGASFCRDNLNIDIFESIDSMEDTESESFDAVTLWDVWEHVHEPARFINKCIHLLRKGGILAVSTSNASSLAAKIFRGNWRYVMAHHLSYFTYPFAVRTITESGMNFVYEEHTIKVQCFIEGFLSWMPLKFDSADLLRIGQQNDPGDAGSSADNCNEYSGKYYSASSWILGNIRKIVLGINRSSFPLPVGDMMELYFRR